MIDVRTICKKIELKVCQDHCLNPKAVEHKEGIKLSTCCEKFQQQLENYITQQINKQVDTITEKIIQNKNKQRLN